MKKSINDQMLNLKNSSISDHQEDVMVANLNEHEVALEGEIDKGNLQDYLEIYGLDDDM